MTLTVDSITLWQVTEWTKGDGYHQLICDGNYEHHILTPADKTKESIILLSGPCQCSIGARSHHRSISLNDLPDSIKTQLTQKQSAPQA